MVQKTSFIIDQQFPGFESLMSRVETRFDRLIEKTGKFASTSARGMSRVEGATKRSGSAFDLFSNKTDKVGKAAANTRVLTFQLSSAFQDIAIVLQNGGRFDRALLGAANNFGVLFSAMKPVWAILGTMAVIAIPSIARAFLDSEQAVKANTEALEDYAKQLRIVQDHMENMRSLDISIKNAGRDISILPKADRSVAELEREYFGEAFRQLVKEDPSIRSSFVARRGQELFQEENRALQAEKTAELTKELDKAKSFPNQGGFFAGLKKLFGFGDTPTSSLEAILAKAGKAGSEELNRRIRLGNRPDPNATLAERQLQFPLTPLGLFGKVGERAGKLPFATPKKNVLDVFLDKVAKGEALTAGLPVLEAFIREEEGKPKFKLKGFLDRTKLNKRTRGRFKIGELLGRDEPPPFEFGAPPKTADERFLGQVKEILGDIKDFAKGGTSNLKEIETKAKAAAKEAEKRAEDEFSKAVGEGRPEDIGLSREQVRERARALGLADLEKQAEEIGRLKKIEEAEEFLKGIRNRKDPGADALRRIIADKIDQLREVEGKASDRLIEKQDELIKALGKLGASVDELKSRIGSSGIGTPTELVPFVPPRGVEGIKYGVPGGIPSLPFERPPGAPIYIHKPFR